MGEGDEAEPGAFVIWVVGFFEGEQVCDGSLPEFEFFDHFEETLSAVFVGMGFAVEGVEFGVAGVGEKGVSHGEGCFGVAEVDEVTAEPFVVVGVVVDLVGEEEVLDHVGVIDAGGGFLGAGGVFVLVDLGIDVAGHVPHVGNGGSGGAEDGGGVEGL